MINAPLILGITGALLLMAGLAISGGLSHDGRLHTARPRRCRTCLGDDATDTSSPKISLSGTTETPNCRASCGRNRGLT